MRTKFFIILIAAGIIIPTILVFAAGGGSGGSVPTCTDNIWTCTDWSSCSTSGTQTRTCALTFSCASATNQKPTEIQSCTTPTPIPAIQPSNIPSAVSPTEKPLCTSSTWECGPWSASCDVNGQEHRSCHLVADCPRSPTSSPAAARACSHLQCGDKATLHERISCRLGLAPSGVARELQIQYLPEECRTMKNVNDKKECISRYKQYQPCWNLPAGDGRFQCARNALKLGLSVADQVHNCQALADKKFCVSNLREKVLYMIKFRFYDLEQRAEDLYYRGADPAAIADFDTIVETKKQEFDTAKTDNELQQIILDVRSAWKDFVNRVTNQVK